MVVKKIKKYFDFFMIKIVQKKKEKIFNYNNEKVKYLFYKNKKATDLIVVFSACTRPGIKARYNYVRTLKNVNSNKLFILDDGGTDNRGTYYLGQYPSFDFEIATEKLIEKIYNDVMPNKVFFVGSSKGGWASLNFGLNFNNSIIICGAPQYYIGTYLDKMNGRVTIKSIGCNSKKEINYLDEYLSTKILKNTNNVNVFLQYSINDPTYKEHIQYLIAALNNKKYNLHREELDYKNHDDVSLYFPKYIIDCIKVKDCGDIK